MIRPIDASNSSIYRTSLCHHADALNGFHGWSSHTQKFRSTWKNGYIPVFHKSPWWFNENTVDGQNPAPPRMMIITSFTWFYTSQVVQDFFLQQYLRCSHRIFFHFKVKCWRFSMFFSRKWLDMHGWIIIPIFMLLSTSSRLNIFWQQ